MMRAWEVDEAIVAVEAARAICCAVRRAKTDQGIRAIDMLRTLCRVQHVTAMRACVSSVSDGAFEPAVRAIYEGHAQSAAQG